MKFLIIVLLVAISLWGLRSRSKPQRSNYMQWIDWLKKKEREK